MSPEARKRLKKRLVAWLARRRGRRKLTAAELHRLRPRRLLVVRQHNQMGDMVCATPAFRALKQAFEGAELALVCAPFNREVVCHNPDLDRVFVFDRHLGRLLPSLWRLWRDLRAFRPDLTFVLNSVSFSVTSAAIALASRAPFIIGGDSQPFGWDVSRHVYSLEMPSRPELDRQAVLHSLAPLQAVGITTDDLRTVVVPSPAEEAAARALLSSFTPPRPLWVMHPGAGKLANLWSAEGFAAIAGRAAAAGARVLVLQGPADRDVIAHLRAALDGTVPTSGRQQIEIVPVQPVGVCAALLVRAERFLCNDTGLMHVAGAVGVPTLALFGPTDPDLWKPLAASVVALRGATGRLDRLTQDTVWEALQNLTEH